MSFARRNIKEEHMNHKLIYFPDNFLKIIVVWYKTIDLHGPYIVQRCVRTDVQTIFLRSTFFVQYVPLTFREIYLIILLSYLLNTENIFFY